jgi:hypothetical protein
MVIRNVEEAAEAKDTIETIPTIRRTSPPLLKWSYIKNPFRMGRLLLLTSFVTVMIFLPLLVAYF